MFVIVDQFIDRTFGRSKSFFGTGLVAHVSIALAKLSELTIAQIQAALGKQRGGRGRGGKTTEATLAAKSARRRSKLAGRKIAPKYRNPANKRETWAGRGRAPKWAADLKTAGKLDSALIR